MSIVPFPEVGREWPSADELASSVSAREHVREEMRHFVLHLAREIWPQCGEADAPSLGELATWWRRASDRSRDAADEALAALLGSGWSWRVTEHPVFDPDEPVLVAVPGPDRRRNSVLSLAEVQEKFVRSGAIYGAHPLIPVVRAWLYERPVSTVAFRPRYRASLPRFQRAACGERDSGMLLSDAPALGQRLRRVRRLPFDPQLEVTGSCPSWLLEMYRHCARGGSGGAKGLAWSFRFVVGGLVHLEYDDRDGRVRHLRFAVEELIDWLELVKAGRWPHRARDYPRLAAALDETGRYEVTLDGRPCWVVSSDGLPAVFEAGAACTLAVRVPPGAAVGMRIDWPRFRREAAASAIRARAYLSLQALLDRSARKGHPVTRQIRSVSVSPETGKPLRAPGGDFVRRGPLVPNPAARYAPFLPERHLAAFVGRASSRAALHDARAAVLAFSREPDPVVELARERGGWRVYAARSVPV